jgi:hypothetical protein
MTSFGGDGGGHGNKGLSGRYLERGLHTADAVAERSLERTK